VVLTPSALIIIAVWQKKRKPWQTCVTNKACCLSGEKVLDAFDVLAFQLIPIPQQDHDKVIKASPSASCFDVLLIDGSII
jgi:hypothetical protein